MGTIDFILNIVALWLWLNWRGVGAMAAAGTSGVTLLRTLRRAETAPGSRWGYVAGLAALLVFRAVIYGQVGGALHWTPHLQLGVVSLPFRSDAAGRMLLFSGASFAMALGIFYLWLIALSLVNHAQPDADPVQRLVRLELGWAARLPGTLRLALPAVLAALCWLAASPALVRLGILPPPKSLVHTAQQSLVMGLTTFLAWQYLLVGMLLLHLLSSYIYLGSSPLWQYVNVSGRNLLAVIGWIPLRLGRFDFAPLVGLALVVVVSEAAAHWMTILYGRLPL